MVNENQSMSAAGPHLFYQPFLGDGRRQSGEHESREGNCALCNFLRQYVIFSE